MSLHKAELVSGVCIGSVSGNYCRQRMKSMLLIVINTQ